MKPLEQGVRSKTGKISTLLTTKSIFSRAKTVSKPSSKLSSGRVNTAREKVKQEEGK
jgi:hypothetical protein